MRMKNVPIRRSALLGALLAAFIPAMTARGQMFGARTLGTPITGRAGITLPSASGGASAQAPGQPGAAGQQQQSNSPLSGNERFLRGNRQAGNFVGRTEERGTFVGNTQGMAAGGVASAVTAAPPPPLRVNRVPQTQAGQNRPYSPSLSLGFDAPKPTSQAITSQITERLARLQQERRLPATLQLEVRDSLAILRGVVDHEKDRTLAEQVVRLEPGVARIQNLIQVRTATLPTP